MFRYTNGDVVVCTGVTEENHEGLVKGRYYVVMGASTQSGTAVYCLSDIMEDRLVYSIDRFNYIGTRLSYDSEVVVGQSLVAINNVNKEEQLELGRIYTVHELVGDGFISRFVIVKNADGDEIRTLKTRFAVSPLNYTFEPEPPSMEEPVTPVMKKAMCIYYVRELGRQYAQTEGSAHYKDDLDKIEPIEYGIANGMFEDFAIMNVVKYITRFKKTRNLDDLKKVSDYAQILCGVELSRRAGDPL